MSMDFMTSASCAQVDPDLFTPSDEFPSSPSTARKVCRACHVLADCREWVLSLEVDVAGVVAGMGERERRDLRKGKAS